MPARSGVNRCYPCSRRCASLVFVSLRTVPADISAWLFGTTEQASRPFSSCWPAPAPRPLLFIIPSPLMGEGQGRGLALPPAPSLATLSGLTSLHPAPAYRTPEHGAANPPGQPAARHLPKPSYAGFPWPAPAPPVSLPPRLPQCRRRFGPHAGYAQRLFPNPHGSSCLSGFTAPKPGLRSVP